MSSSSMYGAFIPLDDDAGITNDAAPQGDGSEDATAPKDAADEAPGAVALYGGFVPIDGSGNPG